MVFRLPIVSTLYAHSKRDPHERWEFRLDFNIRYTSRNPMEFRPGISLVGYQVEIRQKSRSWHPTLSTWLERGWGALKTYMTKIRTRYHGISTGISKFRFLFLDFHGISSSILNFGNPAIEIRGNLCRYWVGFPYSEIENKNSATRYPVFCGVGTQWTIFINTIITKVPCL